MILSFSCFIIAIIYIVYFFFYKLYKEGKERDEQFNQRGHTNPAKFVFEPKNPSVKSPYRIAAESEADVNLLDTNVLLEQLREAQAQAEALQIELNNIKRIEDEYIIPFPKLDRSIDKKIEMARKEVDKVIRELSLHDVAEDAKEHIAKVISEEMRTTQPGRRRTVVIENPGSSTVRTDRYTSSVTLYKDNVIRNKK